MCLKPPRKVGHWGGGGSTIHIYIYIYMVPPPQRPSFSYINIQSGRWGSQSEIDGMGLRVGGFRV